MMNYLSKLVKNKKQLGYYIIFLPVKIFRKYFNWYFDKKIKNLKFKNNVFSDVNDILILSSFRVNSEERYDIMNETLRLTLNKFDNDHSSRIEIIDSSDDNFFERNKTFFSKILKNNNNFKLEKKKARLPQSYYDTLSSAKEQYFCTFFDDQPILGINQDFLFSAASLLRDYSSLIDIILFEYPANLSIDDEKRKVFINFRNIEFKTKNIEPIKVVKYGEYAFALLRNCHYGFFFNNMIGRCDDYSTRLSWYMNHIDKNSPHEIELAGMRKIGPIFNHIAIPLDVLMVDFDYVHTDIAIRESGDKNKFLFQSIKNGYEFVLQ